MTIFSWHFTENVSEGHCLCATSEKRFWRWSLHEASIFRWKTGGRVRRRTNPKNALNSTGEIWCEKVFTEPSISVCFASGSDFFGKNFGGGVSQRHRFVVLSPPSWKTAGVLPSSFFLGGNFRWQNSHAMFECWKNTTGIYSMGFSVVLNSSEFRWHFFSAIGCLSRHLSRMEFPVEFPLNFAVQCVGASCGDFSGGSVIY